MSSIEYPNFLHAQQRAEPSDLKKNNGVSPDVYSPVASLQSITQSLPSTLPSAFLIVFLHELSSTAQQT